MQNVIKERIEKIRQGEVPEGYKKTDIGIIPNEWECNQLNKEVLPIKSKVLNEQLEPLSISAGSGFVTQKEKFGKDLSGNQYKNYIKIHRGDFSYNKGNSKKYPQGCIYRLNDMDIAAVPNVFNSFSFIKQKPEYYEFLFESGFLNHQLRKYINSGVRNDGLLNLYEQDFYKCLIIVPKITEQQKIADILTKQDRVVELKEKLLDEKKQQKKYLMQQLLTGEKRLPGFNGKQKFVQLGKVCEMFSGGTPSTSNKDYYGDDYVWVSIKDMTNAQKYINSSEKKISLLGFENSPVKLFPVGTVLFAMYASVGECSIASKECCTSQAILGITPNSKLSNEYLYYYLINNKNNYKKYSQTGSQPNLNKKIVQSFEIMLPSLEEQQAIAEILTTADKEIELLEQDLEQEKQKKKALMQLLLTGIVRVTV